MSLWRKRQIQEREFENDLNYYVSKEILWHFVCSDCKNWWSIAAVDDWKPKELYCPHCGLKQKFSE